MCKVVHFRKNPYDVLIDRSTKWGNPYSYKYGTVARYKVASRKEAIEKYEEYLLNSPLFNDLHELKFKTLGCWCSPLSCHGDILKKYVDKLELFDLPQTLF